ncbi:RNA 2',3'-cyclic phosphodiesterase [Nocardioides sp. GCM10028917]|uniref:RNA 2',3'-cyclic phosphodiesterase n=1 Tax=Nocardioides sp. GCM10028917 TaxID=3273408 RepID=UPI00360C4458
MTRMFVAVVPPEEVVEDLESFLSARREAATFRWSATEQWHVTLAVAESVPDRALDGLDELLALAAERRTSFGMRIAGGGAFPHPDAARVLWSGLEVDDEVGLDALAASCRAAMSRAGARVDGQRFHPHLTLGRLGRPANVTSWVRLLDAYDGPRWQVGEVALVASYLGEGARRRPRHEVVRTYALA